MEKLYRVVCANFAVPDKSTGKCDGSLEESVDDALIAFVGLSENTITAKNIAGFLGISSDTVHDLHSRFSKKKSDRFKVKLGLIHNGMRL